MTDAPDAEPSAIVRSALLLIPVVGARGHRPATRFFRNQHALCGCDFSSPIRALVLGLVFYTIRALNT
jgi:hypothetical protein